MNWFKRKIARWANESSQGSMGGISAQKSVNVGIGDSDYETFKNPINITLYNAVGGRIVRFQIYNNQTNQAQQTTYIIPSDLDFNEELSKCITMEALKHTV